MKKRNVTVALDEETARWARVEAARRDISVSAFLSDLLEARMQQGSDDAAIRRFLSRPRRPLTRAGDDLPDREELHDRERLR